VSAGSILLIVAVLLLLATAWDWRRHGGGLTVKRRTWLLVAAIFLGVTLYLRYLKLGG
jgi:hypothetical protein